jgi:PRTRC genetic system protein B
MKTYADLGGIPEFKLEGAVLLYRGCKSAFATYHAACTAAADEAPRLDVAQPLTTAFLRQLAGELGYRLPIEILPENILVRSPEMLVWWSAPRRRTMFFSEHARETRGINGRQFPQPPLVFKVVGRELWVRALAENARPGPPTMLQTAPYWNCSAESGHVCQGSMRVPEIATALEAIDGWERAFFQSEFTHPMGAAQLTTCPGGFVALWTRLADAAQPFPSRYLAPCGETLQQFVERRDSA